MPPGAPGFVDCVASVDCVENPLECGPLSERALPAETDRRAARMGAHTTEFYDGHLLNISSYCS